MRLTVRARWKPFHSWNDFNINGIQPTQFQPKLFSIFGRFFIRYPFSSVALCDDIDIKRCEILLRIFWSMWKFCPMMSTFSKFLNNFWTPDRMHLNAFLGIADNIGWKWYNHNVEYSRINAICSTFSSVQTRKDFTFIFSIRFKGEWTYCHTPHIPYDMGHIIWSISYLYGHHNIWSIILMRVNRAWQKSI